MLSYKIYIRNEHNANSTIVIADFIYLIALIYLLL